MLDDKIRAALEQAAACIGESVPLMARSLYTGLISQGFTEEQAFIMTRDFVKFQWTNTQD